MSGMVLSLLIVLPAGIALALGLIGRRFSRVAVTLVAAVAPLSALGVGVLALSGGSADGAAAERWGGAVAYHGSVPWIALKDVTFDLVWSVDALAALMLTAVGLVGACVVLYSHEYLADDPGYPRYAALVAAFVCAMDLLVIAGSLPVLFVGWELVGACSYLLIGFWFRKDSAANAASKAFMTTRVGDLALLFACLVLFGASGALDFDGLGAWAREGTPWVTVGAILLAIGAMSKSAQFPFQTWLPDAMEGPTPASALIHAATMVAAGVYLVVRMWPVFEHAPAARELLLVAGTTSALIAALSAVFQTDLKKVLAYSTVSQLGFMFAALGAGAWWAALFHLLTHAAFKALLFLGAGSVIHGAHSQDLRELGGLRRRMPITFWTWLAGSAALAGIVPLSGFFSKDLVLEMVFHERPVAGSVLFFVGALTAFYVARTTRAVFFGDLKPQRAHESRPAMLVPLAVLSVPAVALGLFSGPLAEYVHAESEPIVISISVIATALALAGGAAGWFMTPQVARSSDSPVAAFLRAGWRWDSVLDALVVRPVTVAATTAWAILDRLVSDGIVVAFGAIGESLGRASSRQHTGDVQRYATTVLAIVVALLAVVLVMVR